jgi:phosphate transport system substrate-binding protein
MKWIRNIIALACFLAVPLFGGPSRIYVEAFTTKADAKKLRDDLTADLRKLSAVSLVADESNADLILGGGGEIWVRGYRSFSPRSHMKLETNGTPIYGGYLSVELKNKEGVTVWSDLVTPGKESDDISKDLSKRIAKDLTDALSRGATQTPKSAPDPPDPPHPVITLKGAGATFPYPVYMKWFANYRTKDPGTEITYDAIGSEAGIRKLLAGGIDFGASDSPEAIRELAPGDENNYLLFPSVVGAVVPIVNLPGITEDIAFTPEALAGIFLGKIRKWNDPILQRANPAVHLPDLDIVVVHRGDGSGTSYAWTAYLSKTSAEWQAAVGSSLDPKWPVGRVATGNEGVAALVKELGGSIGYVEFIYALQHHLSYGRIRNKNGEFVEASLESIAAAVDRSREIRDDFKASIVDATGQGAYPISSFTWIVVPAHIVDEARRGAMIAFLRWMLGPGQRQAAALGYLALPREIVNREEEVIGKIH